VERRFFWQIHTRDGVALSVTAIQIARRRNSAPASRIVTPAPRHAISAASLAYSEQRPWPMVPLLHESNVQARLMNGFLGSCAEEIMPGPATPRRGSSRLATARISSCDPALHP